jgi:hypothetical protein
VEYRKFVWTDDAISFDVATKNPDGKITWSGYSINRITGRLTHGVNVRNCAASKDVQRKF